MVRVRYSFGSRHTGRLTNINKQRKKFPDVVHEVVKISDIILEVIDSRFTRETRNLELEKKIQKLDKKIIYVLNKADLVKKNEIKEKIDFFPYVFISSTKRTGVAQLRNLIKRVAKDIKLPENKERVQVGIVGYPNTGKSSLINVLIGRPRAKTGNEAGYTKGLQKVKLTKNILLIDSPGVISKEDYSMSSSKKVAKHTKVGSRSFGRVKDPEFIIQELLNDIYVKRKLEAYYKIDSKGDVEVFIEEIGLKKKFLKKGGKVDFDRAARLVLREWQNGLIK